MDDTGAVEELIAAGREDGIREAGTIAECFCDTTTTPFVPSQMPANPPMQPTGSAGG